MDSVTIRVATKNDAPLVEQLVVETDKDFVPPISERERGIKGYIENLFGPSKETLLATLPDGRVVGFATLEKSSKHPGKWWVYHIVVHPDYRGKGMGRLLLRAAEEFIEKKGGRVVAIRTWSTNTSARRFYEKQGYTLYKVVPDDRGPGIDTVVYQKVLRE